ncbi:MAG: hypothetical protein QM736_09655 [Vicinamibacterales bacterium]
MSGYLDALSSALFVLATLVPALAPYLGVSQSGSNTAGSDTLRRTLAWPAGNQARVFELSNISGPVHIVAENRSDVSIVATRTIRRQGSEPAPTMDFREEAGRLLACGDASHCGCHVTWSRDRARYRDDEQTRVTVAFEVRVPANITLDVCTVNGGALSVEGTDGPFTLRSVNGDIGMVRVRGAGQASTVNGDLDATFAAVPTSASSFKSVNGHVDVTFPESLSADLRLKTMNGGLYTDFETTTLPAQKAVTGRRNGRTTYRTDRVRERACRPRRTGAHARNAQWQRAGAQAALTRATHTDIKAQAFKVRIMSNRTLTLSMTLCTLLLLGGIARAQQTPNQVTVPFSEPSRPGTVKVNVLTGGISVKPGTGRDVIVTTTRGDDRDNDREEERERAREAARNRNRSRGDSDDPDSAGLRRLTQPAGVNIQEENNVIDISAPALMGFVQVNVQVPPATSVVLRAVNGGNVTVEGISGSIEVTNVNGSIRLTDVSGAVIAHATNGRVVATLRQVVPGKPMSFTSLNGHVDVTIPPSAKANLKLRSDRGDVYTDFDVQATAAPARPTTDTRRD